MRAARQSCGGNGAEGQVRASECVKSCSKGCGEIHGITGTVAQICERAEGSRLGRHSGAWGKTLSILYHSKMRAVARKQSGWLQKKRKREGHFLPLTTSKQA